MQNIYQADPKKIIVCMVGCNILVIQYLQEVNRICQKKYIDILIGQDLKHKFLILETLEESIVHVMKFYYSRT